MTTERLLKRREVQDFLGVTTSTFYRMLRSGDAPAPVMIGKQSPRWKLSEIEDWLNSLPRGEGRPRATGQTATAAA